MLRNGCLIPIEFRVRLTALYILKFNYPFTSDAQECCLMDMKDVALDDTTPPRDDPVQPSSSDAAPPVSEFDVYSDIETDVQLSPEQQDILNTIKGGRNIYFTGPAGQLPFH